MTSAEERKTAVIQEIIEARKSILELIRPLELSQWREIFLGEWSLIDLVAHLIGWDQTNLQAVQELRESRLPEFYSHIDRDWRSYNAVLVSRHRSEDVPALMNYAIDSHARLVEFIQTIDAPEFDHDWGVRYKGYRVTITRLLEAEAGDEKEHARQINTYFYPQLLAS